MSENGVGRKDLRNLIVAIVLLSGAFVGFDWMNKSGWVPHSFRGQVYYPSKGWEVGQYVFCGINARAETKNQGPTLDCNDGDFTGTFRVMDVRIWGIVEERVRFYQCRRNDDSISCHFPQQ